MVQPTQPPHPKASNEDVLLTAEGVTKRFGGVQALRDGSFELRRGEVHAIMGENGAGKSTFGKILAGVFPADSGRIVLAGKPFAPPNPPASQARGVAMIFQELDLFPNLTVAENMVAANQAFKEGWLAKPGAMRRFAAPHLASVGLEVSPGTLLAELPVGRQQLVAIARALSMDARVIVMDESTSALTEDGVARLFTTIQTLRERGVAIIYVSHKLDEIFTICDRVTVLRDGKTIGTRIVAETSREECIRMMVGRDLADAPAAIPRNLGAECLHFDKVSTAAIHQIDMALHAGEIVGIAGLVGSGRSELGRALFGLDPLRTGRILVRGEALHPRSPAEAMAQGIGLVPEDRKAMGLMMQMSVRENSTFAILPRLRRRGAIDRVSEAEQDGRIAERTHRKSASPHQPVQALSGGNQQKVLLGRWLLLDPDILFLDDPTRGVDVGAKEDIYRLIEETARSGKGVLMVSSELPELLRCCDRILVMNHGHLVGELDARRTTQEAIMKIATQSAPTASPS